MSDDERIIERALSASSACLLPALSADFDSMVIHKDVFNDFRFMLDDQLMLLLDILYQNGNLLRDKAHDNQLVQLRVNILILACEQTEANPFFLSEQKILFNSLARLLDDNFIHFDDVVIRRSIETYKNGLKKNSWKKQLGMIHSFAKFCEIILMKKPESVNSDVMMFMLYVGSNLVSHYEPNYKSIGVKVYRQMMENGDKNLLKDLNIHQVIYSESFPMIQKSSDLEYNDHLYECLLQVVAIEDSDVRDSKWCKFDDVMTELLTQFAIESNEAVSLLLLEKIVKFCGVSYEPLQGFDQHERNIEELKAKTRLENYRTMRWIKKLMEMMIRESSKLMNNSSGSHKVLVTFHFIYIITISNMNPLDIGQQLTDFTKKLVLILMRVAKTFKDESKVISSIVLFINTIGQHQHQNEELLTCLDKILCHDTFQNQEEIKCCE